MCDVVMYQYGLVIQDTVKLRAVKCDIKIMLVPYEGATLSNSGKLSCNNHS
jgi:hypothetical protein